MFLLSNDSSLTLPKSLLTTVSTSLKIKGSLLAVGSGGRLITASPDPLVLLSGGRSTTTRTVTNTGSKARYFSSSTSGFEAHDVSVTPAALPSARSASTRSRWARSERHFSKRSMSSSSSFA